MSCFRSPGCTQASTHHKADWTRHCSPLSSPCSPSKVRLCLLMGGRGVSDGDSSSIPPFKKCFQVAWERSNLKRGPESLGHLLTMAPQGTRHFYGPLRAKSSCPPCLGASNCEHSQEGAHGRGTSAVSLTASQDRRFCPACYSEGKGVTVACGLLFSDTLYAQGPRIWPLVITSHLGCMMTSGNHWGDL